ncbi:heavy metal translocatin [Polyplosphaeria fusca]|uniref:Heavy metal translocatin n=1 Tax=Polyplosphaeria fusca TaxID=682080 RepID=A0A9P4R236_9PLEO|nr:heavy metal translocatin [Polyplosphaeria fusca]
MTFERVTLTINGLKCGCCESGISKAVRQLRAVRNPQVNIVLARVEFDLDTSRLSVTDAISQLARCTGYTFAEYIPPQSQVLEILVNDSAEIYKVDRPHGVKTVGAAHLYRNTVEIQYNAKQTGARRLFEHYQAQCPRQRIDLAPPTESTSLGISSKQTRNAVSLFVYSLSLTIPVLVIAWAPIITHRHALLYDHVSLVLATAVQCIATTEFVPRAAKSLIHSGYFDMDFLIALTSTTAYVFSVVSYTFKVCKRPLETGGFFETSTLLVTLIFLGRAVSEFARLRAAKSVSFRSLQVEEALLATSGAPSWETRKIDARLLQYGDHFKVPAHTKIVTDGKVSHGGSEVDESMITGESRPVGKGIGSAVCAGTTNGAGQLIVEVTALPYENSVSKIADMVENAELSKPKIQALADQAARWFVPTIAVIGLTVFLIWMFVDRYHHHRTWKNAVAHAVTYAIATIVVSCPCAIGLAVPMVVLIAGGIAARFNIIFRDPQKLEVARSATDIVFDKTGTLTTGNLVVEDANIDTTSTDLIESLILGLLQDDTHPVARAVVKWLTECPKIEKIHAAVMKDITSIPGQGVTGRSKEDDVLVRAGNPEWLGVNVHGSQHTIFCVTVSGALRATFWLRDRPRAEAECVVQLLTQRGLRVHMISGDGEGAVNDIAHSLGIPKTLTAAQLRPEDKQGYIQRLQEQGAVVIFCGDGTNDSVALKQADVGVHLNHGSDTAKGASDVVLMTRRLHSVPILLDISKVAYRRILFNFGWSALYNVVAVLMASGAFVKVRIPPAYAALGELVSVVPVVLIAFQIKWKNFGKQYSWLKSEEDLHR